MNKLNISDVYSNIEGFSCKKIKKLSDKKLVKIEDFVNDDLKIPVLCANIEYMGYLTVTFIHSRSINEKEIELIVNFLNSL